MTAAVDPVHPERKPRETVGQEDLADVADQPGVWQLLRLTESCCRVRKRSKLLMERSYQHRHRDQDRGQARKDGALEHDFPPCMSGVLSVVIGTCRDQPKQGVMSRSGP